MNAKISVWVLLAGMIDHPGKTLGEILANPRWRWLLPALIAIASIVVFSVISVPMVRDQASQAISTQLNDQLSQLPADQAARIQSQMEFFQSPAFLIGAGIGGGVIGLVFGWILQATLLYLLGLIAGADVSFVGLVGTLPWLGLPDALRRFIQTAYVATKGQLVVNEGLSYLVSSGVAAKDARNIVYILLSFANPFDVWLLVLVFALFRGGMKFSTGTAFGLTAIFLAIRLAAKLGMGALSGMFSMG